MEQLNSKKFKALQSQWYKKLKKSGFEDIENSKGDLKKYESATWNRNTKHTTEERVESRKAKADYYRIAGQFLHDYLFETALDKKIWTLHSIGKSYRVIADGEKDINYKYVYRTVLRLKKEMRKFYSQEDI